MEESRDDDDELVDAGHAADQRRRPRNSPDSAAVLPLVEATSELLAVAVRGETQLLSDGPVAIQQRLSSAEEEARARLFIFQIEFIQKSIVSEGDFKFFVSFSSTLIALSRLFSLLPKQNKSESSQRLWLSATFFLLFSRFVFIPPSPLGHRPLSEIVQVARRKRKSGDVALQEKGSLQPSICSSHLSSLDSRAPPLSLHNRKPLPRAITENNSKHPKHG